MFSSGITVVVDGIGKKTMGYIFAQKPGKRTNKKDCYESC
jgi:hypothetical protein